MPKVAGDATRLPFADGVFDAVTISFGLRNVVDHAAGLREMARVTRPGGRLVVCEFSTPTNTLFATAYKEYLMQALPRIARKVSSNPDAYVYLAESIRAWPDQAQLAHRIARRRLVGGALAQPERRHRRPARRRETLALGSRRCTVASRIPIAPSARIRGPIPGWSRRSRSSGSTGTCRLPSVTPDAPMADRLAAVAATEKRMGRVLEQLAQTLPSPNGVVTMTTTIAGVDGNDIALYITHPNPIGGELPGVVHFHGGGMAINSVTDSSYTRARENLAATGLVVVGVEFRNAGDGSARTRTRRGSTTARPPSDGRMPTARISASAT